MQRIVTPGIEATSARVMDERKSANRSAFIRLRASGAPRIDLFRRRLSAQVGGSALAAIVLSGAVASAAGFDEPGQSVLGQGASNAGIAAGGSSSSMFWN